MLSTFVVAAVATAGGLSQVGATTTPPAPVSPIPMEQSVIFPAPTLPPEGIGTSPIFNALAAACYGGAMDACGDLRRGAQFGSQYESYGETCAGRQPSDSRDSCSDLLAVRLAQATYSAGGIVVQPGEYFGDQLSPGIYVSGPITGESCSWSSHDEWGYTTNSAFVSSDGLGQAVTAVMILPTDAVFELDSDCGPITQVEQWAG